MDVIASLANGVPGIDLELTAEFKYAMRYGAPLMIGWTVLLFWADRKPAERKDILLITAFPVVVGYVAIVMYAMAVGFASIGKKIPILVMQAILLTLFCLGYWKAKHIEKGYDGYDERIIRA